VSEDPLANFDRLTPTKLRRGNNRKVAYPYVSVREDGEVQVVFPDDATIRAWNDENWNIVTVAFAKDRSELALTKAADDFGVGIRRYPKQKVCVHVIIRSLGRARPTRPIGTCTVRREGDTFFFSIAEQITIEPR
jgi:hypothetical protein